MKTLLLNLSILFSIGLIHSQTVFNRAYHDTNELANPFVFSVNGDTYFTTQNLDANKWLFPTYCTLYKHSSSGNLIFRKKLGYLIAEHGFKTLDNKLIILGRASICDVLDSTMCYINKFDLNGNILFSTGVKIDNYERPTAAFQHQDSSYYVFTESQILHFSKSGQFNAKYNLGLSEISSALSLANGSILISAISGGNVSFITISGTANLITTSPSPTLMTKMSFYGGQKIIALGKDNKFYKFRTDISLQGSSSFSGGLLISDFICNQDTIYSLAYTSSSTAKYAVTDTSFNSISLSTTTTHSLNQRAICMTGNKIAILSNGDSKSSYSYPEHTFASLSVIDKLSDQNFTSDIALTAISIDSIFTSCYQLPFPPYDNKCNTYLRAKITVKNNGPNQVSGFKLNCFKATSPGCGGFFYQEQFQGLSFPPGATLNILSDFVRQSADPVNTSTFNRNYCFYATLPNGETDKVVEDNELCITGTFVVTSLNEVQKDDITLSLYPIPFNTELMIEADSKISQISIYNTLGQVIKTQEASDKKVNLNNTDLHNGIYFLHIKTEKGTVIKKVLKN